MRRRLFVLVAVIVMVATACGGDSDGADQTTTAAPTTTLSPEQASARQLLLETSDLPDGWAGPTALSGEQGNVLRASLDAVPVCLGQQPSEKTSEFASFQQNQEVVIAFGQVFDDAAALRSQVDAMKTPAALECLKTETATTALRELERLGVRDIAPVVETSLVTGVTTDANSYALRTIASTSVNGRDIRLVTDLLVAANDTRVAGASLAYFNEFPPAELEQQVMQAMRDNVA